MLTEFILIFLFLPCIFLEITDENFSLLFSLVNNDKILFVDNAITFFQFYSSDISQVYIYLIINIVI